MPSTYTLNNGIELIATGEQSGTWGDTTNLNLSLIDTALDGQVTVTLPSAGTSGSPNALAISDGSASDGRNRLIIFADGGDLGATAYVQLTPNDAEKIVYIRNNLSGSRSIIVFQGTYNASNDYEIPAGTTAVIFFNGGGAGAVAANVFNNAYFDSLRLGGVSVTAILDEDDMASDSATALATQQSIKAYVDAQVAANNELSEVLANGNTSGGNNIQMTTTDEVQFRDTALKISSSADGQLDIDADVEVEIVAPTLDIDASTAVTIDTATLTMTGSVNVVGDLDVDNLNLNGNAITSTNANGNIDLTPNGTGEVNITKVDIDSGTIDGTTIGGASAAAGTFTTATATTVNATTVNATTVDTTNIEVTNIKAKDGTASATIADSTGVMTIASSVLTTTDINGGTIDGTTIGGTTAAAGSFTTVNASGNITSQGQVITNTINEQTATSGVTVDGVLLKDNGITATGGGSLTGTWSDLGSVTTIDINGGTIDGTVIGGSTPAAISGTTGQFGTSLNVDGTVTADGLRVDGNAALGLTAPTISEGFQLHVDAAGNGVWGGFGNTYLTSNYKFNSGNKFAGTGFAHLLEIVPSTGAFTVKASSASGTVDATATMQNKMLVQANGDISFYEDTGTTPKFFWDASAEALGIGTSSPSSPLHVVGNCRVPYLQGRKSFSAASGGVARTVLTLPQVNFSANSVEVTVLVNGNDGAAVRVAKFIWVTAGASGTYTRTVLRESITSSIDTIPANRTISDITATATTSGSDEILQITATHGGGVTFNSSFIVTFKAVTNSSYT